MIYKLSALIVIVCIAALFTAAHFSSLPQNIGITGGKLSPCPDSPNCVSSQENDQKHATPAIKASGPSKQVMKNLRKCVRKMGGKIKTPKGPYLHAEFRSKLFRFVDDLECVYDEVEGKIEVRSAARLGYSDFGVNRKRVEELRRLFEAENK
ncbi:DUF1499 domain-containing protein [Desulfovibrio sp. JC010]|uniref:DUF1499 domain-containing protein n=1 Tax=Desulfovibrio sp. JC010 TaxID=2593641 RepID=UPI0013D5C496|nr:DUF1499 domain-containing protein [Desulfovibrio sp. JC010]NDV25737.1 DUF1499 domain-containing protein [Desulfovibrio sp. JC010]